MQKIIVSDASCLILLSKINQIELLKVLFGSITITKEIAEEYGEKLPDFFKIRNPKNPVYKKILQNFLDSGEASIIALALEQDDCLIIIDEAKGRNEAKALGLKVTGTLGVLLLAKEKGLIKRIKPVLEQIELTNFRIDKNLIAATLKEANE